MTAIDVHQQRMWRASLVRDSLLTFEELLEVLPSPSNVTREWISQNVEPAGLIGEVPLYVWGDVLSALDLRIETEAPRRKKKKQPTEVATTITSWRGVARTLGISEDTLSRHRRDNHDTLKEPWFADAQAVQDWWRRLHEAPPLRRTGRA